MLIYNTRNVCRLIHTYHITTPFCLVYIINPSFYPSSGWHVLCDTVLLHGSSVTVYPSPQPKVSMVIDGAGQNCL